jgi:predicted glycogen debranching enzyme
MGDERVDLADEWLEPDCRGGFASGTVGGERTRRYHALLLTAVTPPTGRLVLVNGLEAWIESGTTKYPLSTQRYAPNVIYPDGNIQLSAYTRDPWPIWTFRLPDGTVVKQDIFVPTGTRETVLRWRRSSCVGRCRLIVRLLLSGRDYHALHHENGNFRFDATSNEGNVRWQPYLSLPAVVAMTNGIYTHAPVWYRNFIYTAETARGLDDREDLASPGEFEFEISDDSPASIVLRAGDMPLHGDPTYPDRIAATELVLRKSVSPLIRAARMYRATRGRGQTLIAGFPWFTDWGRDTFIAMRGLVLELNDLQLGEDILIAWADTVSQGMLPNRFPDGGEAPEYNAVDASLWYIIAAHEFLERCAALGKPPAPQKAERLQTACEIILAGYAAGTRFGIGCDEDGLLCAGVPGLQLTWMDAKVGDYVITPRVGKPVEIQALWINALRIGGARWSPHWRDLADRATQNFAARFVNPSGGLFDVVDVGHVAGTADPRFRPNQIFAIGGLPFALLTGKPARAVVDLVEAKLLTPMGLRSLSPEDPGYIGRYSGDPVARDGAYHQGTVWPWLMGPFVDAYLSVRGRSIAAKAEAKTRFLAPLMAHLETAGLGHVSEVADGDAPHHPGGCPFQAWSLGELIRIRRMLGCDV